MPADGYLINSNSNIPNTAAQLIHTLALSKAPPRRFRRDYLDSFDWRLLNKGYWLQADHDDDAIRLQLFDLHNGQLITQLHTAQAPRFATELGQSKLATLLSPILDVRALLPHIETEVTQQRLQQLNRQDKITGELYIEQITPTSSRQPLKLLHHLPVKGYDKEYRAINKQLKDEERLRATDQPPLQLLLNQLNIEHNYNSKPNFKLDPAARADAQIKQLLAFFLDVMRRNQAGIIDDIDTEFLHDFRIAVRRSRTLLSQVPDIMPQHKLDGFKYQLARLGQVTTPLRDLDVMLLNFDDYRALLPDVTHADLDPALAFIRRQRQAIYNSVRRHLTSKSHAAFCRRWHDFLHSPPPADTRLANAKRMLKQVADERIRKNYKKVLKQGKAITDGSPADDLHTLRKRCKKLRYLLEFFCDLYPKKEHKALIATLKQLQDNLGEFQDIHVHMDFFAQLRDMMHQQDQLPTATAHAIDQVITTLDIEQQGCRRAFHGRFKTFSSKPHQQRFQQLFKP